MIRLPQPILRSAGESFSERTEAARARMATLAARPCVIQLSACESFSGRRVAVRPRLRPILPNHPVQVALQLEMERHDHDLHKSKGSPDTT